jgi:excisionase family DNA binding protein
VNDKTPPHSLSKTEAAKRLNVSVRTLERLLQAGDLEGVREGPQGGAAHPRKRRAAPQAARRGDARDRHRDRAGGRGRASSGNDRRRDGNAVAGRASSRGVHECPASARRGDPARPHHQSARPHNPSRWRTPAAPRPPPSHAGASTRRQAPSADRARRDRCSSDRRPHRARRHSRAPGRNRGSPRDRARDHLIRPR